MVNSNIPVLIVVFNHNTSNTIMVPLTKGYIIVLTKSINLHFVIFIAKKLKPIFAIKMLKNTANDEPNIPHLAVKG